MEYTIPVFIIVGFIAQLIDGCLGMAYGVSSTTFLLSLGIPPVAASASVHTAEVFTTGVSGISHLRLGNADKKLVKKLIFPGVTGGIIGAYVLSSLPGDVIKPFVAFYLFIMGVVILYKSFKKVKRVEVKTKLFPLGMVGGFFDAIGGGGWGPIVTSTLVARGNHPRFTIGSVNLSEFFVTVSEAATFFTMIGLMHWQIIFGLMIGGVVAAPLAAYICKKLPTKTLMIMIGIVITTISIRTLYLSIS